MPSDANPASELAALRATAHPTRRALLDLLGEHTTLTASECARLLGMSPKACSYHLGVLADQHLIMEMPAPGRNRPWRRADQHASADDARPAHDLVRDSRPRLNARVRRNDEILGTAIGAIDRAARDPGWSEAVSVHSHPATMSADEVAAWAADVERLTRKHVRRAGNDGAESAQRSEVHLMFVGFPS